MSEPLLSGAFQLMIMLSLMNTVVGAAGLSGTYAARMATSSEVSPSPTLFVAVTLNL